MARGHGELGVLDNLRTFADLADDSGGNRRPFVDFLPGAVMTQGAWVVDSGRTYVQRAHFVFADGMLRDVVGVATDVGKLTRVESLADCRATAGTYFADIDAARLVGVPYWDDGITQWDGGGTFDQFPPLDLYVHLQSDTDPNGVSVVALLGFYWGTVGEVHPVLGADKIGGDGAFESAAQLATFTESLVGAGQSTALDSTVFWGRGSTSSLKLVSAGSATGSASRFRDFSTVAGARYRLSGYYETTASLGATCSVVLLLGDPAGTMILFGDGREFANGGNGLTLTSTPGDGRGRRFLFDFIAPASTTRVQLRLAITGSPSAGQVNFDGIKLQRIYRFVLYEPVIPSDAFEDLQVGATSIFFGVKPLGTSNLQVIDGGGYLESTLAVLNTSNKAARVALGGSLADGQEIYRDHWSDRFYALSRGELWLTDERLQIGLEDPLAQILDTELPPKRYSLAEFPNMDLNREGYVQPMVLGNWIQLGQAARDAVPMTRIDVTAAGYGIYHLADVSNAPDGLDATTPIIYQYVTGQLRDDDIAHPARLLTSGTQYSWDRATGRLTILRDLRTYRYDNGGNAFGYYNLDFNIGAATLTAGASADDSEQQATDLTTSWTAAAGTAVTWSYSTVTHKFTVSKAAGTLNLLCKTGNPLSQGMWQRLGFKTDADRTGALSYTADTAVFDNPEASHFLSAMITGIRDDAAGTYTGTASATIIRPAEMFYFVLQAVLGETVDVASILAARNLSNIAIQECREHVGSSTKVRDFFGRLAASGIADIVIDGSGIWYYKLYSTVASIVAEFTDRDYLTFRSGRRPDDVYSTVELSYGQKAIRNVWRKKIYSVDPGVKTKHGRTAILPIATSRALHNAQLDELGVIMATLAAASPRMVEFSARGKLVDLLPGDKIRLYRSRAIDQTGQFGPVVFRILSLRSGLTSGVTTCLAVEDVAFSH